MSEANIIQQYISAVAALRPARRWGQTGGYKDVLKLALPLIASTSSASAMLFTDRLFLSRYSMDAIAASLPAGVMALTMSSFFLGLVSYVSVFAAQYSGAGRPWRAAAAMWQGIYLSLAGGALLALCYFIAPRLFAVGDHAPAVQELEVAYFRVLTLWAVFDLLYVAMSSFLAGLGRTQVVMWVSLAGAAVNIPLDYALIYGLELGGVQVLPEWGVFGAAVATVISWALICLAYAVIIFRRGMEKSHGVFSQWRLDWKLTWRLAVFGSPGGLQFLMEIAAFAFFAMLVGQLGEIYQAANNIVFSIESLSFFPMIGIGQAASIMMGQAIGRGRPDEGAAATHSGLVISSAYLAGIMVVFLVFPEPLLNLFLAEHYEAADKAAIVTLGTVLLRFVVAYGLFDGIYLCCFGAVRGAGDVWFPMLAMGFWGLFGLVVPSLILLRLGVADIYNLWAFLVFYILGLTFTGLWRYRAGHWRHSRVIEPSPVY